MILAADSTVNSARSYVAEKDKLGAFGTLALSCFSGISGQRLETIFEDQAAELTNRKLNLYLGAKQNKVYSQMTSTGLDSNLPGLQPIAAVGSFTLAAQVRTMDSDNLQPTDALHELYNLHVSMKHQLSTPNQHPNIGHDWFAAILIHLAKEVPYGKPYHNIMLESKAIIEMNWDKFRQIVNWTRQKIPTMAIVSQLLKHTSLAQGPSPLHPFHPSAGLDANFLKLFEVRKEGNDKTYQA